MFFDDGSFVDLDSIAAVEPSGSSNGCTIFFKGSGTMYSKCYKQIMDALRSQQMTS